MNLIKNDMDRIQSGPIMNLFLACAANASSGRCYKLKSTTALTSVNDNKIKGRVTYLYENEDVKAQVIMSTIDKLHKDYLKVFVFVIIQGNKQNFKDNKVTFNIVDLIDYLDGAERKTINKALSKILTQMQEQRLEVKAKSERAKKKSSFSSTVLLAHFERKKNGDVVLQFSDRIIDAMTLRYQPFPKWAKEVSDSKGFNLLLYVYHRIFLNKKFQQTMKIKVSDACNFIGIPSSKEEVINRKYKEKVYVPLKRAIDSINILGHELSLTIEDDYSDIESFFDSKIIINIDENHIELVS